MAKSVGKRTKKLNGFTKPGVPVINTPAGMYAPDWDDPKVQLERVVPKSEQPRYIGKGPSGIEKGR